MRRDRTAELFAVLGLNELVPVLARIDNTLTLNTRGSTNSTDLRTVSTLPERRAPAAGADVVHGVDALADVGLGRNGARGQAGGALCNRAIGEEQFLDGLALLKTRRRAVARAVTIVEASGTSSIERLELGATLEDELLRAATTELKKDEPKLVASRTRALGKDVGDESS